MRWLARLLAWFLVVEGLITTFGVTTAPLLLSLAVDTGVAWLLVHSCLARRRYAEGSG